MVLTKLLQLYNNRFLNVVGYVIRYKNRLRSKSSSAHIDYQGDHQEDTKQAIVVVTGQEQTKHKTNSGDSSQKLEPNQEFTQPLSTSKENETSSICPPERPKIENPPDDSKNKTGAACELASIAGEIDHQVEDEPLTSDCVALVVSKSRSKHQKERHAKTRGRDAGIPSNGLLLGAQNIRKHPYLDMTIPSDAYKTPNFFVRESMHCITHKRSRRKVLIKCAVPPHLSNAKEEVSSIYDKIQQHKEEYNFFNRRYHDQIHMRKKSAADLARKRFDEAFKRRRSEFKLSNVIPVRKRKSDWKHLETLIVPLSSEKPPPPKYEEEQHFEPIDPTPVKMDEKDMKLILEQLPQNDTEEWGTPKKLGKLMSKRKFSVTSAAPPTKALPGGREPHRTTKSTVLSLPDKKMLFAETMHNLNTNEFCQFDSLYSRLNSPHVRSKLNWS